MRSSHNLTQTFQEHAATHGNVVDLDLPSGCILDVGAASLRSTTALNTSGDFGVTGALTVVGGADITGTIATHGNVSIGNGYYLTVANADALLIADNPVGTEEVFCIDLWSHASLVTRNLFYAQTVGWTVTGIVYEPEIAEGTGSVVCTVCKVTGNNVAVAATTPMCTAFAVTGTAGTPVVATLTSTAADLVLAATNKIGCIFSGGDNFLDSGRGRLYIKMKRS